jgi:hypothetical protein
MRTPKKKPKRKRPTPLAALRKVATDLTQVQVSERSGLYQSDVSKLERRPTLDDVTVGTVRRYVEALGGELRLVAALDAKTYELAGAEEEPNTAKKK